MADSWAAAGWLVLTIALYYALKPLARWRPRWWTSPLLTVPAVLLVTARAVHTDYAGYIRDAHLLLALLGPATVAFALPIWRFRALIRRHWPALTAGVTVGSGIAIGSCWLMAHWLALNPGLMKSLIPRSITTPFAMQMSADIGGTPQLTAVFVVVTALAGMALGDLLLVVLPLRSAAARGTLLGLGASGAGVAQAQRLGHEEAAVASLVMVLCGILNVSVAPLLAMVLR